MGDSPDLETRLQQLMAEIDSPAEKPIQPLKSAAQAPASSTPAGWLTRVKAHGLLPLQILAIPWAKKLWTR
jgi:hypothetical protein